VSPNPRDGYHDRVRLRFKISPLGTPLATIEQGALGVMTKGIAGIRHTCRSGLGVGTVPPPPEPIPDPQPVPPPPPDPVHPEPEPFPVPPLEPPPPPNL
jgi:hypothetical protein